MFVFFLCNEWVYHSIPKLFQHSGIPSKTIFVFIGWQKLNRAIYWIILLVATGMEWNGMKWNWIDINESKLISWNLESYFWLYIDLFVHPFIHSLHMKLARSKIEWNSLLRVIISLKEIHSWTGLVVTTIHLWTSTSHVSQTVLPVRDGIELTKMRE